MFEVLEGVVLRLFSVFALLSCPLLGLHRVHQSAPQSLKEQLQYNQFTDNLGILNDCNESPISYSDLENLATSAAVTDQVSFLTVLNKQHPGALQTFTLVYDSQSAQSAGISRTWPGVIRSNVNSSVVFRYVCDRSQIDVYNRIEVAHFIPETKKEAARFEFVEFDLSSPKLTGKDRIQKNPDSCIGCHAADANPRPNWEMYPDWKGMFGSHDDIFVYFDEASPIHQEKLIEKKRFHDFRAAHLTGGEEDDCYRALPWPQNLVNDPAAPLPPQYENFPYGITARSRNYTIRPNLKFTETFSHLLGDRNFSAIKFALKEKGAETSRKTFLLLALEAAHCDTLATRPYPQSVIDRHLNALFPQYARPTVAQARIPMLRGYPTPQHEPRHPLGLAQALFATSLQLGLYPMDWTLQFIEYDRSDYESAGGFGGTGLEDDPFPSVFGDYSNYLNSYAKTLPADEQSPLVDWIAKAKRPLQLYGDLPLTAYTQNLILKHIATEIPELQKGYWDRKPLAQWDGISALPTDWNFTTTRGEEEWFGEGFSCIDDLGGAPAFRSQESRDRVCGILRETAVIWGMREEGTRGPPQPKGIQPEPPLPPARLALFRSYLKGRFETGRERDAYIESKAGRTELKGQKFIDSLKARKNRLE